MFHVTVYVDDRYPRPATRLSIRFSLLPKVADARFGPAGWALGVHCLALYTTASCGSFYGRFEPDSIPIYDQTAQLPAFA